VPKIGNFRNCLAKEKPVDQVDESVDRAGVAGPRFHRGLHSGRRQGLAGAWPSGHSGPRRLAARVATGRARPGDHSPELGRWRGGGAHAVGLRCHTPVLKSTDLGMVSTTGFRIPPDRAPNCQNPPNAIPNPSPQIPILHTNREQQRLTG
jgi:hypothetical protein